MRKFIILALFVFIKFNVNAQLRQWDFEIFSGFIYNFPSPLTIHQENEATIKLLANYKTEPFKLPPYYDLRITTTKENKGWDFEFFHHKIILTNKVDEIQHFAVTHGYNIFTLKRVLLANGFVYHFGGGFALNHPESTIRNKQLNEKEGIAGSGYYLSGIVVEGAIDKRFYINDLFYVSLETKLTSSYSKVPVNSGHATIALVTIHGIAGFGLEL